MGLGPGLAVLAQSAPELPPDPQLLGLAAAAAALGVAVAVAVGRRGPGGDILAADGPAPRTEPPAVLDQLLGCGLLSTSAVPATIVDLVERGHLVADLPLEPSGGVTATEPPAPGHERDELRPYERSLLRAIARREEATPVRQFVADGDRTRGWRRTFVNQVDIEGRHRGLIARRPPLAGRIAVASTFAFAVGAVVAALPGDGADVRWGALSLATMLLIITNGLALIVLVVTSTSGRSAAGDEAVAQWLAIRRRPEGLGQAHRAVLALEPHPCSDPLVTPPDPHRVWAIDATGSPRPVRIHYPRWWPPGAGRHPLVIAAVGAIGIGVAGLIADTAWDLGYGIDWIDFSDIGPTRALGIAFWAVLGAVGIAAVVMLAIAVVDMFGYRTVEGTAVRARVGVPRAMVGGRGLLAGINPPGARRRSYLAVDDGTRDVIRALVVSDRVREQCPIGTRVEVRASPITGHVRKLTIVASA